MIFDKASRLKEKVSAELTLQNKHATQQLAKVKEVYFDEVSDTEIHVGLLAVDGTRVTIKFKK